MYTPSLPVGHVTQTSHFGFGEHGKYLGTTRSVNIPPIERMSGFDSSQYADDMGLGLHFDYRPLAFYFETGKLRIGF